MKVKELFIPENGIFETIFEPEFPNEYLTIFGETNPKELDMLVLLGYGNRELIKLITKNTYQFIVRSIITMNVASWVKMVEVSEISYDVLQPNEYSKTRTETVTTTELHNDEDLNAEKYFNDVNFIDNERKQREQNREREEKRDITDSGKGSNSNLNPSESIQKEIELRKIVWKQNILNLLIKELTLDIYK